MTEYRDNRNDDDFGNTQYFKVEKEEESAAKKVLSVVYEALMTKGYDPVNQIVGYIMSGDPTYITNYMGARSLIMKVERDELVEEILKSYIKNNRW
ncbi:MAG: IreB family regulatory phosphoprotein [Lachnospiraceae bacterium]|nr:IreB family regulatory phosphoprotein [Lachnospiraceae bacterium]MDY6333673.1 IreB family regulatory phosphoprotein [Lachnospiraceae bacterium]